MKRNIFLVASIVLFMVTNMKIIESNSRAEDFLGNFLTTASANGEGGGSGGGGGKWVVISYSQYLGQMSVEVLCNDGRRRMGTVHRYMDIIDCINGGNDHCTPSRTPRNMMISPC